jgi:deoxyadenosine/deoxycytidine kinase
MEQEERDLLRSILGGKTLCLEGAIGAGKTEFMRSLAKYLESNGVFQKVNCYEEDIPYPILERFNVDPNMFAMLFQTTMMTKRLAQGVLALENRNEGMFSIVDTGILRELAFSLANKNSGFMEEEEYNAHMDVFYRLFRSLHKPFPDFMILLEADTSVLLGRIKKRGRMGEDGISPDYLEEIINCHQVCLKSRFISKSTVKHFTVCTNQSFFEPEEFKRMIIEDHSKKEELKMMMIEDYSKKNQN